MKSHVENQRWCLTHQISIDPLCWCRQTHGVTLVDRCPDCPLEGVAP